MIVRFASRRVSESKSLVVRGLLAAVVLWTVGCGKHEEPPVEAKKSPPKATASSTPKASDSAPPIAPVALRKWERPIVCQPQLKKADGSLPQQGTGFFVLTTSGKLAAVSSAHFLDFNGSPVVEVAWLRYPDLAPMAAFTTSWGNPGGKGTDDDLSTDYWLMPVSDEQAETVQKEFEVLEFDERDLPKNGERIWLPNKDERASLGFTVFDGRVISTNPGIITVELDRGLKLQSQSGSPIISRQTNKVIGTLCSGVVQNGKTFLWLAPVAKMRTALSDATQFPALSSVIGKTTSP